MKCLYCKKEIENSKSKYCNSSCKKKYFYNLEKEQTCKYCNTKFKAIGIKQYCSIECKNKAITKIKKQCPICGSEFKAGYKKIYCCEKCYRVANSKSKGYVNKICTNCNKTYRALRMSKETVCSQECEVQENNNIKKQLKKFLLGVGVWRINS